MFHTSPLSAAGRKLETTDGGLWPKAVQGKNFSRRDHMSQWRSECSLHPAEKCSDLYRRLLYCLFLSANAMRIQISTGLMILKYLRLICGSR